MPSTSRKSIALISASAALLAVAWVIDFMQSALLHVEPDDAGSQAWEIFGSAITISYLAIFLAVVAPILIHLRRHGTFTVPAFVSIVIGIIASIFFYDSKVDSVLSMLVYFMFPFAVPILISGILLLKMWPQNQISQHSKLNRQKSP